MQRKYYAIPLILSLCLALSACDKDGGDTVGKAITTMTNECIKRNIGPNLVGGQFEFAYTMAVPQVKGNKLTSMQVEATFEGGDIADFVVPPLEEGFVVLPKTYIDPESHYTDGGGKDAGILVAEESVKSGKVVSTSFIMDTVASTLRFYYVIPEAARGKKISFVFSSKGVQNGKTVSVSYKMGPYEISNMDMARNIVMNNDDNCYFSIADMKAYTAAEAAQQPGKIDLVYLKRSVAGVDFNYALNAPTAEAKYFPNFTLAAGVSNATKIMPMYNLQDQQLSQLQYGRFVDDLDLKTLDFKLATNRMINAKVDAGLWVQTADGTYRAYIFINKTSGNAMTISLKRLKVK